MYVLVLVACMTFESQTSCQSFTRAPNFASNDQCRRAAELERGRYASRIERRRDWLAYSWRCGLADGAEQDTSAPDADD